MSSTRSSSSPPPEPSPSELIQEEVNKIKRLLGLDINRLAIGSDIEGIAGGGTGLFGPADYTITGVNVIEFINVSTSIVAGTQTGT